MGELKHHLPLEPPIPSLTLSSPDLVAALTQAIWWDELLSMHLSNPHTEDSHQLGPPFHSLLSSSGRELQVLAYTGNSAIPDSECAAAIIHALTSLINMALASTTLESIIITLSSAFVRSSVLPNLLVALPSLGFSRDKGNVSSSLSTILALATRAHQKTGKLPASVRLSEVTTPEGLSTKIAIESSLFPYSPSYINRLRPALEYMTYGTANARDHHYLAWFTPDGSPDGEPTEDVPIGFFTLRVGRGVAYAQGAGVIKAWRRRGITRAMLDHAIEASIQLGFEVMGTMAWTESASAAWHTMGFQPVGEYNDWIWTKKKE